MVRSVNNNMVSKIWVSMLLITNYSYSKFEVICKHADSLVCDRSRCCSSCCFPWVFSCAFFHPYGPHLFQFCDKLPSVYNAASVWATFVLTRLRPLAWADFCILLLPFVVIYYSWQNHQMLFTKVNSNIKNSKSIIGYLLTYNPFRCPLHTKNTCPILAFCQGLA